MPERFECTTLAKKRYINTLPFLSFLWGGTPFPLTISLCAFDSIYCQRRPAGPLYVVITGVLYTRPSCIQSYQTQQLPPHALVQLGRCWFDRRLSV